MACFESATCHEKVPHGPTQTPPTTLSVGANRESLWLVWSMPASLLRGQPHRTAPSHRAVVLHVQQQPREQVSHAAELRRAEQLQGRAGACRTA